MKKLFAFALSLALAMVTLLCGAAPSAFAASNLIRTVSTKNSPALDCSASLLNQYSASANNLCWSGTNTSNYTAFSLKALEAGVQSFPFATNTAPTLELYNDTASTTVSVKLAGNMGAGQPISCQGTTGSTGCEISGPLGTFSSQMRPDGIAVYPGSSPAGVTVTFFGVPLNAYVGLQWDSWKGNGQALLSFGGQVANYLGAVSSCSSNAAATIVTGTVYAPNGVDPLPNALVYVPTSDPGVLNTGVQCTQTNATPQGGAITSTVSATDGSFTLTGVPAGTNIPVVIQVGKWRIQRTIATVAPCGNNALTALSTTLPSNQFAGDMPKIAVMTGAKDAIECVLRKTGVADSEFTNNNGSGRIHIYLGGGNGGARINAATPGQEALVGNAATLSNYDMVLLPSQGAFYPQTASDLANIYQWANSGGRLFASHDSVTWLANNPANGVGFGAAAQWDQLQANASASTQLTFNTPVGVAAANQCGRVLYVAHPAVDANANGTTFPEECNASPMTSDERRMEYSLFDLSNATTSPVAPAAPSSLASGSSLSNLAAVSSSSLCGGLPCATAHDASTPTSPLGIANAYNLVALKGDISDTADITGRIAAAGQVTLATTVGTALRDGDPYIASASENGGPWAIVAAAGIPTSDSFNVNAGGNVYSLTPTAANFNFVNEEYTGSIYSGSTLVTGGTSPIDFSALSTGISNLSSQLSSATVNGLICSVDSTGSMIPDNGCPSNPTYFNPTSQHYNPSWLVLYGTDPTANVFNLTQAQFESSINNLDIEIPTGSTAIINVAGTDVTLHTDVYFQGNTVTDVNAATILFNFANATKLTINGQLDGAVLAPNAALSGLSQMGGVFIAASIGATGEVHYIPFTGTIPTGGTSTPLSVTCAATTTGEVGVPFNSGAMSVSGGTAPYTFSIVGTLPAGLTLNTATGAVTGTPTVSGSFSVKVTDAAGASSNGCAITINPALSATCAAVTTGQVGVPFNSGAMSVSGGTAPYTFSVVGTLPAGLTLNTSTGAVTGTPTASGTFSVKVADANGVSSEACAITISSSLSVTCAAITSGEVGVPFDSGPMTVTGGTTPYTYSVVGTLPAGLTLNTSTGAVTGTPTASGSFSVKVTDANGASSTGCAITINSALSVTCAAITTGEVGVPFNSGAMSVSGGTAPYTFSVVGTLPAGLTLNTSTGAVTGTPTASGSFSVKVTDANGASSTGCAITINTALSVSCAAVTTGEVGVVFNSGAMTVSGGTAPYTYSVVGTLPAGLTLNTSTGAVTGTPTAAGTFSVKVTDANGASSSSCAITINSALNVACAAIKTGEVGIAFNSGPMTVTGGTAPYTYSVVGTLPAGLTLNTSTGAITGTPTASGTFSVKVTDANGASSSSCAITINSALSVTCAAITTGEVGVVFNSGAMSVSGGTAPYTYTVVGTLPAGLTLNTSTGAVTGTPTAAGTFSVKVTDANGASSSSCAITINSALNVACAAIKTGEVGVAFNSGPMTVTGGTSPYTYSIVGTLPAGLSLNTSTGAVTGTPTASGSFSVKVTDANGASSSSCAITINPALNVACAAINAGQVGVAFNSGAMTVSGGTAPYTYSVVGTLPAGLALNTSTGAVTGTPTSAGSFSIKVTDAGGASSSGCAITISAAASLSIVKSADTASIAAGSLAGFKVTISNPGTLTATGLTLSDALPAGAGNDIQWAIDSSTGNPTAFTITGATGNQTLAMNGTQSLAPGASLVVHIIGATTTTGVLNNSATVCGSNVSCSQSSAGILITAIVTGTVPMNALVSGDTATIGYWQNNNGQALILSMNGSANSTVLANWLATNFPYLYGVESTTNLTGKTNTDVAAQFVTFFSQSGKKTNAQVMAGAIAVYVTNTGLAGSNVASTKGFNTSITGTGAKTLNVGSDGSSAGLMDNKTYTVMQLLQQANLQVQNGTFDSTTFNDIFTDINEGGDVGSGNNTTAVTFTCPTTTSGALNVPFNSGAITVSGGTAPYTFSVVGTLPAGLSLNTSTGAVTGTPTTSGSFSLKVTDSKGATATDCTFNIGAGYNLTVNPSTVTVVAGQMATTTFTFSPFGGYTGTVNFSCSGLPVGAACTFSPSSLTANGLNTVQTSTLTITTTANGTVSIAENRTASSTTLASIFLLPGMLLGGFIGWRRRSLKGGLGGVVLLALFTVMIGGAVGCGSGLVNTPIGTQQVKVVAKTAVSAATSAGSMTEQTANFTLIITQ